MSIGNASLEVETVDCVVCGQSAASIVIEDCPDRLHGTPGRYSIVRCEGCGLLRTNPRPTAASIGRHYPSDYLPYTLDSSKDRGLVGSVRKFLESSFERRYGRTDLVVEPDRPGQRLLDIGAGTGGYGARMAAAGWDVWALEPSGVASRPAAVALGEDRVTSVPMEEAEYPEGFFDLVTMNHVLEHLHDPCAGLRRVRTWIRPGGRIRVTVPNVESPERKLVGSSWLGFDLPRHLFHFSPQTLGEVLQRSGYVVESNVPQWLPSMFAQSVALVVNRALGRTGYERLPYYAAYPVGVILACTGLTGAMTATAVRTA